MAYESQSARSFRRAASYEVVPAARRIAMLFNPLNPLSVETVKETETAARARTITLVQAPARSAEELPNALQRVLDEDAAALIGAADVMISQRHRYRELRPGTGWQASGDDR